MKTLLVYGIESVAGANIAQTLSNCFEIVGVDSSDSGSESPEQFLTRIAPDAVLDTTCCGDSPWNPNATIGAEKACQLAVQRAEACSKLEIGYTLLSSDAVFTGPWMFHEEDSEALNTSEVGQRLLKLEANVQQACPNALIIRTHLFGWNEHSPETGWIERMLKQIESPAKQLLNLSLPGYATPILASEFATIYARAIEEELSGIFHISGAERTNRQQFARRLAELSNINWLRATNGNNHYTQSERDNFGCGEMSLQTRAIRKALCVAMPTLTESLSLLLKERSNQKNETTANSLSLSSRAA